MGGLPLGDARVASLEREGILEREDAHKADRLVADGLGLEDARAIRDSLLIMFSSLGCPHRGARLPRQLAIIARRGLTRLVVEPLEPRGTRVLHPSGTADRRAERT
jgi:hypothetical protein